MNNVTISTIWHMTNNEISNHIGSMAELIKEFNPHASVVLFTLAGDLQMYGAEALANICEIHATEMLNRAQQIRRDAEST